MDIRVCGQSGINVVGMREKRKRRLGTEERTAQRRDRLVPRLGQLEILPRRDVLDGVREVRLDVRPDQMRAPRIGRLEKRRGLMRKLADQRLFLRVIIERFCDLLFVEKADTRKLAVK